MASSGSSSDPYDVNYYWVDNINAIYERLDGTTEFGTDFNFKPGNGNQFKITLGDAGGTDDFEIYDSGPAKVFGVDSNGNVTLSGTADGVDLANHDHTGAGTNGVQLDHTAALTNVGSYTHAEIDSHLPYFHGAILETISIVVTSAAGTITFNLEKESGGDLTLLFSDGLYTFDCTPTATVSLTAGAGDDTPQINYIYILQSNKTLTVSTSGFPATEHAPLATVIVQTAATVATDGALKVHAWTEHLQDANNQGHATDVGAWIRQQHATWFSGVVQTLTITPGAPDTVHFATTSGTALQLHTHAIPAFNTAGGTKVYVVNDSGTPYTTVTDLADLLTDNDGGGMSGKYFNLVLWCSVSEDSGDTQLFLNLPGGSYNKQSDAEQDVSGHTVFGFPTGYKGAAILISRLLLKHSTGGGGTWTSIEEADLRGALPSAAAGTTTQATATVFADTSFQLFDDGDVTALLSFQLSGISTGTTRTVTIPDASGNMAYTSASDGTITADAISAVEGEATLDLLGDVGIAVGKSLAVDTMTEKGVGTGITAEQVLLKDGNVYPGSQSTRYISDNGSYTTVSGRFQVDGSFLYLVRTDGPSYIECQNFQALPAGSQLGRFRFWGKDDGDNDTIYGQLEMTVDDDDDGSEDAHFAFRHINAGGLHVAVYFTSAGEIFADVDGSGGKHISTFDAHDDAQVLQLASRGQEGLDKLVELGIAIQEPEHHGYMMSVQKFSWLLAGGVYQNRARIDAVIDAICDIPGVREKLELKLLREVN